MFIHLIPVLKCLGVMCQVVGAAFSFNFSAGYYERSFYTTCDTLVQNSRIIVKFTVQLHLLLGRTKAPLTDEPCASSQLVVTLCMRGVLL